MRSEKSGIVLPEELPFPKLMISKGGRFVLFSSAGKGCIVYIPTSNGCAHRKRVGDIFLNYNMAVYSDYDGTITLCND